MKRIIIVISIVVMGWGCSQKTAMDSYIDELMSQMTLEERIGQLNLPVSGEIVTGEIRSSNVAQEIIDGRVGGLFGVTGAENIRQLQQLAVEESRLGIPLIFGLDVIHGYHTIFPIPLGMAATWDMEAIERSARIAAMEASSDGICWTFSPMVDIARDPRWGRVSEGAGEDPFLGSAVSKAMVKGYQGNDLAASNTIMACVKHYALYGAAEAGRDYNTVDVSRTRMYNDYLPPYKAAVDAGVGSVMTSFNEVDGVPATANKWLLDDVLRREWDFGGFVVTDYTAIAEMVAHGIGDPETVARRALDAGVDMDMVSEYLLRYLTKEQERQIDIACRRILEAKYKLGLFEDPYRYCRTTPAESYDAEARRIAAESFVLLKNKDNLLPLKNRRIALVGVLGDNRSNMVGTWSVTADLTLPKTLREALSERINVVYAQGSNLCYDAALQQRATMFGRELPRGNDKTMLAEALRAASSADIIVAALGEASEMSGDSSSRTDLNIPDAQRDLLKALAATGKPVVLVLFTGRPLTLTWEDANVDAILNVWFGGSQAADAIVDVLLGDVNPSGKLPMSFPKNVGQIPIYYAHKNTGRPLGEWFEKFHSNYLDVDNEPLYPFGYGLSYTTFEYSNLSANGMNISVDVTNTGIRDGAEVVQLYVRDLVGTTTRPVRELKGFERIFLKAGETQTVTFTLTKELLSYWIEGYGWVFEAGDFEIFVGNKIVKISL